MGRCRGCEDEGERGVGVVRGAWKVGEDEAVG